MKKFLPLLLLFSILFYWNNSYSQKSDSIIFGKNDKAGRYVNLRGIKMYYETYGEGEPLLVIHGNGGSIADFTNQIPYFSKYYKLILPDSRAQGKSVDAADSLSYEMMTDDFKVLLDTLNIKSCSILGWSDGGIEALLMAIHYPDRVKKLAFTGANLWPDTTALTAELVNFMTTEYASEAKKPLTSEGKNKMKLLKLMIDEPHITTQQLNKIHKPTLVIGGDRDLIKPIHTVVIAESIPGAYLWIVPNSGHGTLIEHKEDFNRIVFDFLKGK